MYNTARECACTCVKVVRLTCSFVPSFALIDTNSNGIVSRGQCFSRHLSHKISPVPYSLRRSANEQEKIGLWMKDTGGIIRRIYAYVYTKTLFFSFKACPIQTFRFPRALFCLHSKQESYQVAKDVNTIFSFFFFFCLTSYTCIQR